MDSELRAHWQEELAFERQRWAAIEARYQLDRADHERRVRALEARLAGLVPALQDTSGGGDDKVTLDVGGRLFSFHRSSLLALHGSWFAAAFSQRWERGAPVFVDRDARLFELYIAPFIRGRRAPAVFADADVEPLLEELGYFHLPALTWLVYGRVRWTLTETQNGALSNGSRTLTHVLLGDCISVGSVALSHGVHVWRVRFDSGGPGVMLGVALADGDLSRVSSARNLAFRWRLDCSSGGCAAAGEVRGDVRLAGFDVPDGLPRGAVVYVKLDTAQHTLHFALGADEAHSSEPTVVWQLACATLPAGAVFVPYVHLTRINTVVTVGSVAE